MSVMADTVTIRVATAADVPAVSALWVQMVHESRPHWTPNVAWWQAMALMLMQSGLYTMWVAESDGELVGFLDGMVYPEPATGQVHGVGQHFWVSPEHRHTGIPGKLYRAAHREAKRLGVSQVEHFCFPDQTNRWAKKAYQPVRVLVRKECHV